MRTLGVRLLLLLAVPSCSWLSAQEETIVLGRRSSISAPEEPSQTIVIGEGARLRERPDPDSAVMEVFATSIELPVLERQGPWVQVRFGVWLGWVDIDAGGEPPSIDLPVNPDIARLERALEIFGRRPAPGSLGPFTLFTDVEDLRSLDRLAAVAEGVGTRAGDPASLRYAVAGWLTAARSSRRGTAAGWGWGIAMNSPPPERNSRSSLSSSSITSCPR